MFLSCCWCCCRDSIVSLLQGMTQLWADNSVFSLQLLVSFAEVGVEGFLEIP